MAASALKGLGKAKPSANDPFFVNGTYKVQIEKVFLYDGMKGDMFIIRAKIVETSNPTTRPVGLVCAQVIKITGMPSALGNIKAFVAACTGESVDDTAAMEAIDEDVVDDLIKTEALNGLVMNLECTSKLTREKKTEFTVHNWSMVKD